MKEIKYTQQNAKLGHLNGVMRVIGKLVYFKNKNNQYTQQVIEQLKAKGADIEVSITGWLKVDMFKNNSLVKLGEREFDVNETPEQEVENLLAEFYVLKYTQAGFKCEVKNG